MNTSLDRERRRIKHIADGDLKFVEALERNPSVRKSLKIIVTECLKQHQAELPNIKSVQVIFTIQKEIAEFERILEFIEELESEAYQGGEVYEH